MTVKDKDGNITSCIFATSGDAINEVLLKAAGEGIFGIDMQGNTQFANPAAAKMTGWSVDELLGQSSHQLLHHTKIDGSTYHSSECPIHQTYKTGEKSYVDDEVFWRKDGSSFCVEYTSSPIMDNGELAGAVVVFNDVSKRRSAERDLQQAYADNKMILEAAGEGIYGLDCEGNTTFVNISAAAMLGYTVEELIGQPMHSLLHHTKPDGTHYHKENCPIYAAFKDGAAHHIENDVFWRKDGTSFPISFTSTPIRKDDKITGAVVVFKDITERKQAEEKIQKAYAEIKRMKERLEAENLYLQQEISSEQEFKDIIGQSRAVKQLLQQVELVAPTAASVLITGESGTGKELIARAIHEKSDRSERPLIRVNCAAIPAELFESEFFGHVKGSFTGAVKDRAGRFELADGGTIFLDEVGEIPIALQSKLLRVLQEGQYERVGDERTKKVDVRLIAATNRNLQEEVEAGNFREDLYFRLNVFPVNVVPLRERADDIPLLTEHFISLLSRKLNIPEPSLTNGSVKQLQGYSWKGNIRELQNIIERAIILSQGGSLKFDLPGNDVLLSTEFNTDDQSSSTPYTENERIARDKENTIRALELSGNKISGAGGAAELLGIKPTTLASRLKNMDIRI
jgi:formate hydrogenlyase transcriptional activator